MKRCILNLSGFLYFPAILVDRSGLSRSLIRQKTGKWLTNTKYKKIEFENEKVEEASGEAAGELSISECDEPSSYSSSDGDD